MKNLTDGLINEGQALKNEVQRLRNDKTANKQIFIENYSQTAFQMYFTFLHQNFNTSEEFDKLLDDVFIDLPNKFCK